MNNNSNSDKQDIVEDVPQMRSVAMHSPMAMPSIRSSPLLNKASSGARLVVSDGDHKVASTGPASSFWKLNTLVALPSMHLLERNNVYVANTEPSVVAQRIAENLRSQSIAATFSDNEAKVQAETRDHVQFTIRLWSDKDQVVVEIQRCGGCSFIFCQTSKAILRAAKGSSGPKPLRCFKIPDCVPQESLSECQAQIEDDLEITCQLLKNDRFDTHMLGMESLAHLTKTTKCGSFAARCILSGDFLSTLLCLVESFRMHKRSARDETNLSEMEEEHFSIMHRHALTVLANCLAALEESGELDQVLACRKELLSESLLESLVHEVGQANTRPHDACQAVRCLQCLVRSSSELKALACQLGAPKALDSAFREGASRHCTLEQESRKLQMDIGI